MLLALTTLFVVAACSGDISFSIGGQSVDDAAVELIEGDLADEIGLGELTADCPQVPDAEVGTEFDCTATTADGTVIEIAGVVDREDHIDLTTRNLLSPGDLETFAAAGVDLINAQQGLALDPSVMDCGDTVVVLEAGPEFVCLLTDPDSGERFDATFVVTDLDAGTFDLEVDPR